MTGNLHPSPLLDFRCPSDNFRPIQHQRPGWLLIDCVDLDGRANPAPAFRPYVKLTELPPVPF